MGGTLCSVIIPVAPSHLEIVTDAIASVQAQTVPCEVIVEYDHDQRGAAHTRNKGVRRSNGLFLVMLDADDILHPTYVESALRAYRPGGYVYSHWIEDGVKHDVEPCETWHPLRTYHFITTLIPRAMFDDCGGFDEIIPALEDADFFLRAKSRGWRAILDPSHLWEYRRTLGTSNTNPKTSDPHTRAAALKAADGIIRQRYGGNPLMCIDCSTPKSKPQNQHHAGDIQATALFTGHKVQGRISGRLYRRPGARHEPLWVDPRDVKAAPQMFSAVPDVEGVSPDVETVQTLVSAALRKPAFEAPYTAVVETVTEATVESEAEPAPPKAKRTRKTTGRTSSRRPKTS